MRLLWLMFGCLDVRNANLSRDLLSKDILCLNNIERHAYQDCIFENRYLNYYIFGFVKMKAEKLLKINFTI